MKRPADLVGDAGKGGELLHRLSEVGLDLAEGQRERRGHQAVHLQSLVGLRDVGHGEIDVHPIEVARPGCTPHGCRGPASPVSRSWGKRWDATGRPCRRRSRLMTHDLGDRLPSHDDDGHRPPIWIMKRRRLMRTSPPQPPARAAAASRRRCERLRLGRWAAATAPRGERSPARAGRVPIPKQEEHQRQRTRNRPCPTAPPVPASGPWPPRTTPRTAPTAKP